MPYWNWFACGSCPPEVLEQATLPKVMLVFLLHTQGCVCIKLYLFRFSLLDKVEFPYMHSLAFTELITSQMLFHLFFTSHKDSYCYLIYGWRVSNTEC